MRILVDIPDDQIQDLAALGKQKKLSRAELVRQAIAAYLSENKSQPELHGFGLWSGSSVDGVDYQQAMRAVWDR